VSGDQLKDGRDGEGDHEDEPDNVLPCEPMGGQEDDPGDE
jgi:hypothetical protein